jgi:opacity protein-like surface antigen
MRLTFIFFLLSSISLFADGFSIGVKGGVPITDAFHAVQGDEASYFTNTHRYLIGPTGEVHLPLGFSIEVDALYKRLGYQYQAFPATGTVTAQTVANSWEFPLLIKWALPGGPIRPFVDAGASFRHISGVHQIQEIFGTGNTSTNNPVEFHKSTDQGFVFGGGLEFKLGRLRISPELRYTRWGGENFRDPVQALLRTNRNQGDFLLGITF